MVEEECAETQIIGDCNDKYCESVQQQLLMFRAFVSTLTLKID